MRTAHILLVGAVLSAAACSEHSEPNDGGNGGNPPPLTAGVNVQDNQYVKASVQVLEGGTVTWTWQGNNQHNVTFDDGPTSATQSGGTFQRTFATAGTYNYHCTVHGASMSGSVTAVAP